jgi:hypothetical protein
MMKVVEDILVDALKDSIKDVIKDKLKVLISIFLPQIFNLAGLVFPMGGFSAWLQSLPAWWWLIFSALILFGFTVVAIYKRIQTMLGHSNPSAASVSVPPYGWEELTRIPYDDVIWIVQRDGRGPDARRLIPRNDPRPSEIQIATPARCAKCETELKEKRRFLGGFLRYCLKCGFKKRSEESFYDTSKNVELSARREIEKTTGFSSGY